MVSYKAIVRSVIKNADIILEVVDARFPDETRNNEVEQSVFRAKKPLIIVMNKCDLVSKKNIEGAKKRFSKIAPTVFISSKDKSGTTMLRYKILELANVERGRDVMVGSVGYPNTGKSSVINAVVGSKKASTSSISGHTRGVQHIKAGSRIKFIDTPGVIPFGDNDEYIQGMLAVKDSTHLSDPIGVALKIIKKMCSENKSALESFYNFTIEGDGESMDSYDILKLIGLKSNFLKQKGEVDEMRTAVRVINDWQNGKLLL
ncbi:MAG: 50S ribosome-binding GTPase [Methanosarcinaceae archaeon]|nr:50S ribosome-binding GTPase [Methanosarcinaceae archaeon]